MKTTLDYALAYIRNGIPVLPLHYIKADGNCSCGGVELNPKCKAGKHPYARLVPHGVKDSSSDEATVSQWFSGTPYNIGIATGDVSGFFVLDRDDKDGGNETLLAWEDTNGSLPKTLVQKTGNGFHYFFKMPKGIDIRNTQKSSGARGIDIRGNGGYICAAPSKHFSGRSYSLLDADTISLEQIAEAPQWLIDKISSPKLMLKSNLEDLSPLTRNLAIDSFIVPDKISDGEGRESFLLKYAGHLRTQGQAQNVIEEMLLKYNREAIEPPLEDDAVLDRARRYQQGRNEDPPSINQSWGLPKKITGTLLEVPKFNPALMPDGLDELALDISERICCPIEYSAISIMIALGSCIGTRIHCKPYQNSSWLIPANVWGLLCGSPSQQKSPSVTEALRPLKLLDKEAADKYALELEQYSIDSAIYEKVVKDAVKVGNRTPSLQKPAEPQMIRYVVNDTSYEKLIEIAKANPANILIWRDELAGWFHSLNKENQKEARGLYLTGWSGTEGYATDRIGRGHVRADLIAFSLLGTIQPDVLMTVISDAVSGGVGNDGLAQRFQLAVYPDPVRTFKKPQGHPNAKAIQYYESKIRALVNLDPAQVGAKFELDGTPYLNFDDLAQIDFDEWRNVLEERLRNPDLEEHPAILAHLGKYRSLLPKLALIIHLAEGRSGAIGVKALRKAKAWVLLLEAHARRIYKSATSRAAKSAAVLSNKIKADKLKDGFTRSDILLSDWAGLRSAEDILSALGILEDKGWIRSFENKNTGGRPSTKYFVNPSINQAA